MTNIWNTIRRCPFDIAISIFHLFFNWYALLLKLTMLFASISVLFFNRLHCCIPIISKHLFISALLLCSYFNASQVNISIHFNAKPSQYLNRELLHLCTHQQMCLFFQSSKAFFLLLLRLCQALVKSASDPFYCFRYYEDVGRCLRPSSSMFINFNSHCILIE